jgi:hypothetical protein
VLLPDYLDFASLSLGRIILNGLNVSMQSLEADRDAAKEFGFLTRYYYTVGVFSISGGTMAGRI